MKKWKRTSSCVFTVLLLLPVVSCTPAQSSEELSECASFAVQNENAADYDRGRMAGCNSLIGLPLKTAPGEWIAAYESGQRGKGIRIVDLAGNREIKTVPPKNYSAGKLVFRNLAADTSVEVWDGSGIEVSLSGNKSAVDAVKIINKGGTLELSGGTSSGGTSVNPGTVTIANGLVINGARMYVNGNLVETKNGRTTIYKGTSQYPAVKIRVPLNTPITARIDSGELNIGDTHGNLTIECEHGAGIHAGSIEHLLVHSRGCRVEVAGVSGNVNLNTNNGSKVKISGGRAESLKVESNNGSEVTMEAAARTASLTVNNAAKIYVQKVEQQPMVSEANTAKVTIGNWYRGWIKKE